MKKLVTIATALLFSMSANATMPVKAKEAVELIQNANNELEQCTITNAYECIVEVDYKLLRGLKSAGFTDTTAYKCSFGKNGNCPMLIIKESRAMEEK